MPVLNRGNSVDDQAGERNPFLLETQLDAPNRGLRTGMGARLRSGILESCANPGCGSGWFHLWRSRSTPVFESGWSCSA